MKIVERGVAAEVVDVDISDITQEKIDRIRNALLRTPIVVLKKQTTEAIHYARFIHSISANKKIDNWARCFWFEDGTNSPLNKAIGDFESIPYQNPYDTNKPYPVQRVNSSRENNGVFRGVFQGKRLDWHSNLNNVNHADGVAIQGYEHCEGTRTDFNNTVIAYNEMPQDLKDKLEDRWCQYEYVYSRWADITSMNQVFHMDSRHIIGQPGYTREYKFWLKQKNIGGTQGVYFFPYNNARIQNDIDRKLYKELKEYLYQSKFVYEHNWEVGDIVLSDQLLSQHKRPILNDEWDRVLEKRVLHRYTFMISQPHIPEWNSIDESLVP